MNSRSRRLTALLVFLSSSLLLGCTTSAMDTENNQFAVDCSKRPCVLHLETENKAENPPQYSLELKGRYLLACAPDDSDFNCRPISCKKEDPCSALGGASFACASHLCQAEQHALTGKDRLAMCLAGSGSWTGSPKQRARLTLVRSLENTDILPAACR